MGVLEEISGKLDSTESKKNTLRKSISSFVTDWQEVEKDLELTQKSFQHYLSEHQNVEVPLPDESYLAMKDKELKEREVSLNMLSEKLESDREELALVEKLVRGRLREVGLTEERLELRERRVEEREKAELWWVPLMEDREKALEMKGKEVAHIREDLELKEKDIEMLVTVCENREKELDKREGKLEDREKALDMKEKVTEGLELKERDIGNVREKELDKREGQLEDREKALKMKEREVAVFREGLELKERDFGNVSEKREKELDKREDFRKREMEELNARKEQLKSKEKQYNSEKELLEIGKKELEQKMKEFKAQNSKDQKHRSCAMKEIDVREKKLKAKEKELLMDWQQCESGNKALDLRMKEFEDRIKAFEIREKESAWKHKKVNDGMSIAVELDGLDVHILLNDFKMDLSSPTEVSKALRSSGDPAFLVLNAMKVLYPPYLLKVDMRFEGSVGKRCILLLEQLIIISPAIQSQLREDALKLATEWKDKITLGNTLEVLAFLYLLASFDLASSFDIEEVMKLFKSVSVAEHDHIPDLCHRLGLKDRMPDVQLEIKPSDIAGDKTEAMQLEIRPPTSDIAPITGAELFDIIVNMKSNESQILMLLQHSSDGAELVLDALHFTSFSDSKEKKISVVKSVHHLLKQLASVSPKIKPSARKRASEFAIDWKSTLTDSNSWEVFAFLLFVGVYGLFPSFGAKYILGLLEIHSHLVKETSGIIRILKLEHNAPDFIMSLIRNKQRLIAFDYVYEFNLVDKIPPVALLKKHVLDSKLATMKCKEGQTETEPLDQDGAISDEISTLKDVIKCILDHSLGLEYSPDMLRERIACLEVERENLKKCITNSSTELNPVEKEERGHQKRRKEHTRKRPASTWAKDVQPSPSKKMRHKNEKFSNDRSSISGQPFVTEDRRGNQWPYSDNLVPFPPIFFQPYQ